MAIKRYDALYINDYTRLNSIAAKHEIEYLEKTLKYKILNYESHNEKKTSLEYFFQRIVKCHKVICASEIVKNKNKFRVILYALAMDIPVLLLKNDTLFYTYVNYDRQEGLTLFAREHVL